MLTMPMERLSPMDAVRRHLALSAALVVAAVVLGLGAGLVRPTVYTAEARLAVGGNAGLSAQAVPGFALASQQLAANYARYVNNAQGQSALEAQLGIRPGIVQQVSASPIPESNVVRVEVVARVATTARDAVRTIADSLMKQVNDTKSGTSAATETLAEFRSVSNQVALAQQASDSAKYALTQALGRGGAGVPELSKAAAEASANLAILQVQQTALGQKYASQVSALSQGAADLQLVENPIVTGNNRVSELGQFGLGGLVAGFLLALLVSIGLERREARRGLVPSPEAGPASAAASAPPAPAHRSGKAVPVPALRAD